MLISVWGRVQNLCPSLHNVTGNDYLWKYRRNLQLKGLMWVKLENILYLQFQLSFIRFLLPTPEISISRTGSHFRTNTTLDAISIVSNVWIIITKWKQFTERILQVIFEICKSLFPSSITLPTHFLQSDINKWFYTRGGQR